MEEEDEPCGVDLHVNLYYHLLVTGIFCVVSLVVLGLFVVVETEGSERDRVVGMLGCQEAVGFLT